MKIVFIGSGNLATRLAVALRRAGNEIVQIYSRTAANAETLAAQVGASHTDDVKKISSDADLYIFALKDSALEDVLAGMPHKNGVWAHTSGSMPMKVFSPYIADYGVLYPLQTFSKGREVDFSKVYIYNEYASPTAREIIDRAARGLSANIVEMPSDKRAKLHLAAVFACNFANHMFSIASDVLSGSNVDPCGLVPLIDETAAKIHQLSPKEAQTGPAVRYDENIINKHISMLPEGKSRDIYRLLTDSIHEMSSK